MVKEYSKAQIERYTTRNRNTGKYVQLPHCNYCGKGVADAVSDPRCNTVTHGFGHWLCQRCAKKISKMTDAEMLEAMKQAKW